MRKTFILICSCVFLFACKKEDDFLLQEPVSINFENVDEALWSYFSNFEFEAAIRGINYDLNALQIKGTILELHQGNVAGVCSYSSNAPNSIEIDATFWNRSSHLLREMIVFHELGHCVIGRNHLESQHSNGTCKSIMRSGIGNCFDNYSNITREDYLDELFLNLVNLF